MKSKINNTIKIFLTTIGLLAFLSIPIIAGNNKSNSQITTRECGGKNLLKQISEENPNAYRKMAAEAQKIINNEAIFWKIEKNGVAPSYLLGTIHVTDKRILNIPKEILYSLQNSNKLIIENTDVLSKAESMKKMTNNAKIIAFTDGSTIEKFITGEELEKFKKIIVNHGMPFIIAKRMRPWFLSMLLNLPACEIIRAEQTDVLDIKLARIASKNNIEVIGLETMEEQLSAMADMDIDKQAFMLKQSIKMYDKIEDNFETTIAMYLERKLNFAMPIYKYLLQQTISKGNSDKLQKTLSEAMQQFNEGVINKRNFNMVDRSLKHIDNGNSFIAVGALHLPGQKGIVNILRKKGYKLIPIQ